MNSSDDYIDWERKRRILLPAEATDEYMVVPIREFRRLRQRIDKELLPFHDDLPSAYFALFGAALATGVAIPPLLISHGLPTWIIPTFIVSACAFLALGFALILVSCAFRKNRANAASEITREMRDLEETCYVTGIADTVTRNRSRNNLESSLRGRLLQGYLPVRIRG